MSREDQAPDIEALAAAACEAVLTKGENEGYEEALLKVSGFEWMEPLSSKKGRCFRLVASGQGLFVKVLDRADKAENEARYGIIISDAGIACPKVLAIRESVIARRFIEGADLSEALDAARSSSDAGEALRLAERLGSTIGEIHSIESCTGLNVVLNDLNLGNFILSPDGGLNVIDLADAGLGDWARDLGALIVHVLTHRPMFTPCSYMMADAVMRGYQGAIEGALDRGRFLKGLEAALYDAVSRRREPQLMGRLADMLDWAAVVRGKRGSTNER